MTEVCMSVAPSNAHLTLKELIECGVDRLHADRLAPSMQSTHPWLIDSGLWRLLESNTKIKYTPEGIAPTLKSYTHTNADIQTCMLPMVNAQSSNSFKKRVLTLARAWANLGEPGAWAEINIVGDMPLLNALLQEMKDFPGFLIWPGIPEAQLAILGDKPMGFMQCNDYLSIAKALQYQPKFIHTNAHNIAAVGGQALLDAHNPPRSFVSEDYTQIFEPIDMRCRCYTCRHYSCAHLQHLWHNSPILATRFLAIHNCHKLAKTIKDLSKPPKQGKLQPNHTVDDKN